DHYFLFADHLFAVPAAADPSRSPPAGPSLRVPRAAGAVHGRERVSAGCPARRSAAAEVLRARPPHRGAGGAGLRHLARRQIVSGVAEMPRASKPVRSSNGRSADFMSSGVPGLDLVMAGGYP